MFHEGASGMQAKGVRPIITKANRLGGRQQMYEHADAPPGAGATQSDAQISSGDKVAAVANTVDTATARAQAALAQPMPSLLDNIVCGYESLLNTVMNAIGQPPVSLKTHDTRDIVVAAIPFAALYVLYANDKLPMKPAQPLPLGTLLPR